ncbi:alcohol dehydrogenase [Desulfosarcina widdelii]|uniref:Alcohol dehydrogenase n=1 Tax=Desulfosarcina widdelii TaxID=947919 RepID=A0A5K7ZHM6_9BACT|nr:6-hydroxycyclohex-1-ene-1-carbonyl-CoA dehydrogenase [Desulfosarcina widdelii]BBO77824.1 alcohol dehydrogenase [Desulfosarcina widdelii]
MVDIPKEIKTWQMVTPYGKNGKTGEILTGKIEKTTIPVPDLKEGEVLVEIAGCGVCHTDLGFFYDSVPTVNKPPLTLGHEISGKVVSGDSKWVGKEVIIPAAMPCWNCALCKTGRGNRCLAQKMPGNSMGIYGGFSSHIPVPSTDLCEVKERGKTPLSCLAVIADAAVTPYQAAKRANLQPGDNVIVIGCTGGVGQYQLQEVKALGAKTVIGIDINSERLQKSLNYGADFIINSMGKSPKEVTGEFKDICRSTGLVSYGWKIFEVSGSKPGQEIGLSLLGFTGKLIIVGFNTAKVEYSISRLMAFDAEIIGTWGSFPGYYPIVMDMALSGRINIDNFVETRPMSSIVETFDEIHHTGSPEKRIVLIPDF